MLRFTAVMFVLLGACWLQFDRLMDGVYRASLWFQETTIFDRAAQITGNE